MLKRLSNRVRGWFGHQHVWDFWGMPYLVPEVRMSCQLRQCMTCGILHERTIGTYRAVNAYVDLVDRVLH